jgi:hypothetical protein
MRRNQERFLIRNIIGVAGSDPYYALLVSYYESDPLNVAGQLIRFTADRESDMAVALGCGDPLSSVWVSPEGSIWAASAAGTVWTTSDRVDTAASEHETAIAELRWRRQDLPPVAEKGPPNVACLFGRSDNEIYAGTFQGVIYVWNGAAWSQMEGRASAPLLKIHGGSDELYAVGMHSTVLRLRQGRWVSMPMPDGVGDTICRGLRVLNGAAYICTRSGLLLEGRESLRVVASVETQLTSVATLDGRVLAGSAPGGAWEYSDGTLVPIKSNFHTIDAYDGADRVFFIESEQKPQPRVVEYAPAETEAPWGRRVFPVEGR